MKPKARQIRLTYVKTGESAVADLLEEESPGVCQIVWDLLPIESKVIHGMYSGAEVFAMLDDPKPIPNESPIQLPLPTQPQS